MTDNVRDAFLRAQRDAATQLTASSDIVEITSLGDGLPDKYIADFHCWTLARDGQTVLPIDRVLIGFHFPENYLHVFEPQRVISVLAPHNLWHPNIRGPLLCPGFMPPGTPLVDLLFQTYEVLVGHRMTFDERWALHPTVCAWARDNRQRYPTDRRPLKRARVIASAAPVAQEAM